MLQDAYRIQEKAIEKIEEEHVKHVAGEWDKYIGDTGDGGSPERRVGQ
jgi:hypothetical protein